jgi:hypothetical protein
LYVVAPDTAVQLRSTFASPAVAVRPVGAAGGGATGVADTSAEFPDSPPALTERTT